jgi:dihydrofolate synthase/folylpolyglutamate synthase
MTQHSKLSDALAELDRLTNWEQKSRDAMRVGLEPISDLVRRLGDPQQAFRSIQVAGTKGKGSTCSLLAAALAKAGYRVGRYASPHVEHISERISLNGIAVDDDLLADALQDCLAACRDAAQEETAAQSATWFDVVTAAALIIFRDAEVEWAVIETGLGGRLDSTNIVPGEIAIITNVELEHTEVLGNSRAAIAREKAGIIKPAKPVVTSLPAEDEAGRVVEERAGALGCRIFRPPLSESATIEDKNAAIAGLALDLLGAHDIRARSPSSGHLPLGPWLLDESTRERGRLPGRLERFDIRLPSGDGTDHSVPVILDGAHVLFNLRAVLDDLAAQEDLRGPCVSVIALAADKDGDGFIEAMHRHSAIFTAPGSIGRFHEPQALQKLALKFGMTSEVAIDPFQAWERACEQAVKSRAWILVTGSFHLVGLLRQSVITKVPGRRWCDGRGATPYPLSGACNLTGQPCPTMVPHGWICERLADDDYDGLEPLDLLAGWEDRRPPLLARVKTWIRRVLLSRSRFR